jgi:hypothetical protein
MIRNSGVFSAYTFQEEDSETSICSSLILPRLFVAQLDINYIMTIFERMVRNESCV